MSFTPFDMTRLGQMKSFFGYLSLKALFADAIYAEAPNRLVDALAAP